MRRGTERERKTSIRFLPDDICVQILVRVPAPSLHERLRYVWFHIISDPFFVDAHLARSEPGILFQEPSAQRRSERSNIKHSFVHEVVVMVRDVIKESDYQPLCSWNGLLLLQNKRIPVKHLVLNPATKQHVVLPPCTYSDAEFSTGGIRFDPSTKKYKVVIINACYRSSGDTYFCEIFILGSTAWIAVECPQEGYWLD